MPFQKGSWWQGSPLDPIQVEGGGGGIFKKTTSSKIFLKVMCVCVWGGGGAGEDPTIPPLGRTLDGGGVALPIFHQISFSLLYIIIISFVMFRVSLRKGKFA